MFFFQSQVDRVGHGLDLTVGAAGADHQIVGEGGEAFDFEDAQVDGFFVQGVAGAEQSAIF